MTLIEEAQLMAGKLTSKEIDALAEGRKYTDVERIASMFALRNEIDGRVALKKAKAVKEEVKHDTEKSRVEALYGNAKEKLRLEKERHRLVEDSFTEEKARHRAEKVRHQLAEAGFIEEKHRHKAERDLHAKAVAQFKQDAQPWRDILRLEREAERAIQAEADKGIDDFLAGQTEETIDGM